MDNPNLLRVEDVTLGRVIVKLDERVKNEHCCLFLGFTLRGVLEG